MPVDSFLCECCHRCFATKRGLGVHQRAKHPNQYHNKALDELKEKEGRETKRRWTEVQIAKMASKEARILYYKGAIPNINEEISKVINGRTIEAIKGKRRPPAYKKRVQDILRSLSPGSLQNPSTSSSTKEGNIHHHQALPRISGSPDINPECYNLLEDTEIYLSPEIYLDRLNSDQRVRGALTEEEKFLDEALLSLEDVTKCKNLVHSFLLTIIKEDQPERRKGPRSGNPLGMVCRTGSVRESSIPSFSGSTIKIGKRLMILSITTQV